MSVNLLSTYSIRVPSDCLFNHRVADIGKVRP